MCLKEKERRKYIIFCLPPKGANKSGAVYTLQSFKLELLYTFRGENGSILLQYVLAC